VINKNIEAVWEGGGKVKYMANFFAGVDCNEGCLLRLKGIE
jgi:hypothetical protein